MNASVKGVLKGCMSRGRIREHRREKDKTLHNLNGKGV